VAGFALLAYERVNGDTRLRVVRSLSRCGRKCSFGNGVNGNGFLDEGWDRHQGGRPHRKVDPGLVVGRLGRGLRTSQGPGIHTAWADTEIRWEATP
jgi:hypothetical protein